ncbi:MAG: glycosyltransferase [Planctomycetota bacterium]
MSDAGMATSDRFTVVISDVARHDRGYKGTRAFWWLASRFGSYAELSLYWFLVEYFGRRNVTLLRPSQLLESGQSHETDWLFVGIPTTLGPAHLANLKFRQLALYDSTDMHGLNFGESNVPWLLSQTDLCLKNFRDRRWQLPLRVGFLPIKRPPLNNRLHWALRWRDLRQCWGAAPERVFDVGFVARPTGSIETNERLRWMLELKRDRPDWKLWGGLVGGDKWRATFRDHADAQTLAPCFLNRRKIGFFEYFQGLCRSRVALAPSGYAPWTYRHFEALYAGCAVVSNDLSDYEFLIPFPRDGMVEVAAGASVVPAIERALTLATEHPQLAEENQAYLNRWLDRGHYSRSRHEMLDRFMAELRG